MVKYNFLEHNESDFPHIGNVDVFKYDNDFDYERFNATQMELQVCSVPWDVGEAHIGARTISGIGNVVYFETKEKRDEWFDSIPDSECYRFTTKYKELHRDMVIDVPIPYDMCAKHNYLVVKYNLFANDDSPVMYEGNDGLREWFWFIREVEFVAPNTTRLHLLDDAFQTWIYDINISGMILERGHAPMFAMKADTYLKNPIANNEYLLTADVNFGEATQVSHIDSLVFNDNDMYACVATSANPQGSWGAKGDGTWNVPASAYYTVQGQPSVYVFALRVSELNGFLSNVTSNYPQFKQTIQGIFFASAKLVSLGSSFTFASTTCYPVNAARKQFDFMKLDKTQFGYQSKYADIAKLYTYPYAHIEVSDENGNIDIVKIEDTSGKIDVSAALSIAYPFVTLQAHLLGVGGTAKANISFRNINQHSFSIQGQWYDTLRSWNIPTFAVVLSPAKENDYSTHFDRAQQAYAADMAKTNADASANTALANANDTADNITDNADVTIDGNTAQTTISNAGAQTDASYTQLYNSDMAIASNMLSELSTASTIAANEKQAAIGAVAGVAQGAIAGIASGNPVGAAASIGGSIVGAAAQIAGTNISNGLLAYDQNLSAASNRASATASNGTTQNKADNQCDIQTDITDNQNDVIEAHAANDSATMKGNALRDNTTALANNVRNRNVVTNAINNQIKQAALNEPSIFGDFSNGESATTKPMAMFANIVTQSKSAIASAGDEFLRYGYMLDRQWDFNGNWNIGKYFTYWKLKDFWVYNQNVPDMYMDKIRFFLFGGVTVWRKPEYIGKVSVYDNLG